MASRPAARKRPQNKYTTFIMGVCILLRVLSRLSVNRFPQRLLKMFYSYLNAAWFGLYDDHLQANRTKYATDPLCFSKVKAK
jgi:hypothetical protein